MKVDLTTEEMDAIRAALRDSKTIDTIKDSILDKFVTAQIRKKSRRVSEPWGMRPGH
jgi:hypothetical protein